MRVDVAAGMGSGVGVMFATMTTAAGTLGAHGAVRVDTAQQAETVGWHEGLGRRVTQARAFHAVIASGPLSPLLVGAAAVVMAALSVLVVLP
jgi:hypothetical protein